MGESHKAEPASNIENRLRQVRMARGLSQTELASRAGITRQAVCAIEANHYLPTTAVALRLADVLHCRVEDLFNLIAGGEEIEGDLIGVERLAPAGLLRQRVKVAQVGERVIVRPVSQLGEVLTYLVPADGLVSGLPAGKGQKQRGARVRVRLLRDWASIREAIAVAGCNPAVVLAGEYLRRRHTGASVVGWTAGSAAAVEALKRGEVHVAGVHVVDCDTGESNVPYLRRHLGARRYTIVTFASWQQGWLVRRGNPQGIRDAGDLARKDIRLVNREQGAGARLLLDQQLRDAGVKPTRVNGYDRVVRSHFAVARAVADGAADVGIGIGAAAVALGLDFLPLQTERYDLVVPTTMLRSHPTVQQLLDTIVSRPFRTEIAALGGYDTTDTGKVQVL
jgi:molybdate-binding protein/DNA-binding XRE family transcriptional regulator